MLPPAELKQKLATLAEMHGAGLVSAGVYERKQEELLNWAAMSPRSSQVSSSHPPRRIDVCAWPGLHCSNLPVVSRQPSTPHRAPTY